VIPGQENYVRRSWTPVALTALLIGCVGCGDDGQDNGTPDATQQSDARTPDASLPDASTPDASGDGVAPTATIIYPPVAGLTGSRQLTVRGRAVDADGVAAVYVDGVPAESDNGFAEWQATVQLDHGLNILVVETVDVFGARNAAATQATVHLSADPAFHMSGMDMDPVSRLIWATDTDAGVLVVDPLTGERNIVSGEGAGSGPPLSSATAVAWDGSNARALVTDSGLGAVVAVDALTGARVIISDSVVGSGPVLEAPGAIALDFASGRLVVVDTGQGALLSIDPNTGDRALISGATAGSGPALGSPSALVLDRANGRALLTDGAQGTLMAVNLATGDRTIISDQTTGGPALASPAALMLDAPGNQALVVDAALDALVAIDLATGFRVIISDAGTGGGPMFRDAGAALHDAVNGRVILADRPRGTIFAVELGTGIREYVARFERGSGVQWDRGPDAATWEVATGRVYTVTDRIAVGGQYPAAVVTANLAVGARSILTDSREGPAMVAPGDIILELGRLVIADAGAQVFFAINLLTAGATVLSGGGVGAGPDFRPYSLALDLPRNRVLSIDADMGWLYAVDRFTGNRSVLSSPTMGSGPAFVTPRFVVVDSTNLRALVTDTGADAIVAVHLVSGARTVLSGPDTGVALSAPAAAALDPARNRLLVTTEARGIVAVDLTTGARSVIAGATTGYGPLRRPGSITVDPETGLAVITDAWYHAVTMVDTITGDRMILSR
jgi:DNA-binding beta-propeller fold protein YncE